MSLEINAMIPARLGSTRLKAKNLALINNKPMIYYAIQAAKDSGVFKNIYLNSESEVFSEIADRYDISFYQREEKLGSSTTKSDEVVFDFMNKVPGDITVWVNSTSPLQPGEEIKNATQYFLDNSLDTLITTKSEQVHCNYNNSPLNYSFDEVFAQTQDLIPVERFVYSIMMWRNSTFIDNYNKNNHALFCGKVGFFQVSKESALIIKTEEDLRLVDAIVKGKESSKNSSLQYDTLAPL